MIEGMVFANLVCVSPQKRWRVSLKNRPVNDVDGFGLIQAQPKVEKSVTYSPHPLKHKRLERSPLLFSIFHTLMTTNVVHLASSSSKERQKS
jgi:hypothetical protein